MELLPSIPNSLTFVFFTVPIIIFAFSLNMLILLWIVGVLQRGISEISEGKGVRLVKVLKNFCKRSILYSLVFFIITLSAIKLAVYILKSLNL